MPTLPHEGPVTDPAIYFTVKTIEGTEQEACPVDAHGSLLVFTGAASADKDGTSFTVNGTTVKVGEEFVTGATGALAEGYDCGGTHYEDAQHILVKDVWIEDN